MKNFLLLIYWMLPLTVIAQQPPNILLIVSEDNGPEYELYDLQNDPFELHNLAEEETHQEVRLRLQQELRDWQQNTADPLVDPEKARRLFEAILNTGIDRPRQLVPYAEFMNPQLSFDSH